MCGCVYWCPLTPLSGGADARVLLSIVYLYLKMKVSSMLELLSFVFAFRTERYLLESTVFPFNLIERCILLLAFTLLQIGVVLIYSNIYLLTFPSFQWKLLLAFMVLVGVVSGQKGGAKGAMRGNRGKVSSWPDNFQDILIMSDFNVTCSVTNNYEFFYFDFYVLLFAGWQQQRGQRTWWRKPGRGRLSSVIMMMIINIFITIVVSILIILINLIIINTILIIIMEGRGWSWWSDGRRCALERAALCWTLLSQVVLKISQEL